MVPQKSENVPSVPRFCGGAWEFSRYADVLAALREPALWPISAHKKQNAKIPDDAARLKIRHEVLEAFSGDRLDRWESRLGSIEVPIHRDGLELLSEFIEPWCRRAAEIVTGWRAEDIDIVKAARVVSDAAADPLDETFRSNATIANATIERYFTNAPIPMAGATFVAVSQTTAWLLANGWLALFQHPEELETLRMRPELLPKAVEEICRYACLPHSVFRCAREPVEIGGIQLAEGDRVVLRLGTANRDPEHFSNPNRIDLMQTGAGHLSLGFGPHSCVGAALVRVLVTEATRHFLMRFRACELCGAVEWRGGEGFRTPTALHVRVTGRPTPPERGRGFGSQGPGL